MESNSPNASCSTATPAVSWSGEWRALVAMVGLFAAFFYLPVGVPRFDGALTEALELTKWYAREHVLLCLIPAFYIAGAIATFISSGSVMRYLGADANKMLSYGVASVSGSVLAVCSCTVLPLFAGIYRMGAGIGPATAFLYSGPAINVLAIILTARVLGPELGIARAVGAVVFAVAIGGTMAFIYRREEAERIRSQATMPTPEAGRTLRQTAIWFATLVGVLLFATWGEPASSTGLFAAVWAVKWYLTGAFALLVGVLLVRWFNIATWHVALVGAAVAGLAAALPHAPLVSFTAGIVGLSIITSRRDDEAGDWFAASWGYAKQIMPLLFAGVLVAGFLLGRPGHEGIIPATWIGHAVGGNSLAANLSAALAGAFMYFATLTEVPILQGLIGAGMGKGPALALLLAGPALSLPHMLVIRSVMGTRKTLVYVSLVVAVATVSGLIYGSIF